jgi:hypothetical protein
MESDADRTRETTGPCEALGDLHACASDDARANSGADLAQRIRSETKSLLSWGQQHGCLYEFADIEESASNLQHIGQGNEHRVWQMAGEGAIRVLKITQPPSYGVHGSAVSYLENLLRCNFAFGDDIRVEGVTETPNGPAILTSQPFIAGNCASLESMAKYFADLGYIYQGNNVWKHSISGIRIADARPANVLVDELGECFPIDVHVLDPVPDLGI